MDIVSNASCTASKQRCTQLMQSVSQWTATERSAANGYGGAAVCPVSTSPVNSCPWGEGSTFSSLTMSPPVTRSPAACAADCT